MVGAAGAAGATAAGGTVTTGRVGAASGAATGGRGGGTGFSTTGGTATGAATTGGATAAGGAETTGAETGGTETGGGGVAGRTGGATATGLATTGGTTSGRGGGGATAGRASGATASFCCVIAFSTSPGREICDKSILVRISSSPRGRVLAACVGASEVPRMWALTFSASKSSRELEWVFFSVTPTTGSTSRMALLLTSSSLARSLIRTLLIRPFLCPRVVLISSSQPHGVSYLHWHVFDHVACHFIRLFPEPHLGAFRVLLIR